MGTEIAEDSNNESAFGINHSSTSNHYWIPESGLAQVTNNANNSKKPWGSIMINTMIQFFLGKRENLLLYSFSSHLTANSFLSNYGFPSQGGSCTHKAISAIAENGTETYYYVLFCIFLYNLSIRHLMRFALRLLRQCAILSLPLLLLAGTTSVPDRICFILNAD
ncbi:unnamed protein product [Sphenostylis stenocarpa]|uniref:Uncharacterized protein n=1 Tax=Sphenostylis stenocarpa TaxID=92480 RepID=A0AA86RQV5_9FABA|nr:unnamed protein product [Sphenostylis stenocarpa]